MSGTGSSTKKPLRPWEKGLRARIPVHASPFRYCFRLPQGYLGSHGLERTLPRYDRFFHLLARPLPPEWPWEGSSTRSSPTASAKAPGARPPGGGLALRGKAHPQEGLARAPGEDGAREFYGGDLWGVLEALPYLEALGVEALYLTPIFQSPSSHRYDTEDYSRVDPHLGGEEALRALYQALEARGMKLILDGVFNHVGATHPWFQKALKDPSSPERGMFTFHPDAPTPASSG